MEIKNSINILFSKFNINYRVLLYLFISMTIVIAVSVSIIIPSITAVFNSPETAELFTVVRRQLGNFLSGEGTFKDLSQAVGIFFSGIGELFGESHAPAVFWVTFSVMCVLIRFVSSICFPVITDVINSFMSSNMSYGFLSNMLKNVKISFSYAFFHTLFTSFTDALIILVLLLIVDVFMPIVNLFSLAIALAVGVLLFSVRLSISAGIVPEMVVGQESNYFKAFKKSFPLIKKNFTKMFGSFCITVFSAYCLIALLTLPTFGIAFFVFTTMLTTFIQILQLVFYYGGHRLRYYTDSNTIVNTAPIEDRLDLQNELLKKDDD